MSKSNITGSMLINDKALLYGVFDKVCAFSKCYNLNVTLLLQSYNFVTGRRKRCKGSRFS